jgi:hypothetical protein
MKSKELLNKEKEQDFIFDVKSLIRQYGFEYDHAMSLFAVKPKTNDELLLEQATKLFPKGTLFVPVGKTKQKASVSLPEWLVGKIWVFNTKGKMSLVYADGVWAEIVKE